MRASPITTRTSVCTMLVSLGEVGGRMRLARPAGAGSADMPSNAGSTGGRVGAAGAAAAGGTGGPRVNRIPHRGQVSTTPAGTRDGSNRYGQLGFGHFSAVDMRVEL